MLCWFLPISVLLDDSPNDMCNRQWRTLWSVDGMDVELPVLFTPKGGCKNGFDSLPNANNPKNNYSAVLDKTDAGKVYRYERRESISNGLNNETTIREM